MKTIQQFMRKGKAVVTLTGTLITTTLIPVPALAQQFFGQQAFPGSMCQPTNPPAKDVSVGFSGFFNSGSGYTAVTCPIPQRFPEDNAGSIRSILINVQKRNSQQLYCYLGVQDGSGKFRGQTYTTTSNQGDSILIFTPAISKGLAYTLVCSLPPDSGILTYTLYEPAQ